MRRDEGRETGLQFGDNVCVCLCNERGMRMHHKDRKMGGKNEGKNSANTRVSRDPEKERRTR